MSAFLTENADQLDLPAEGLFWDAYLLFGPDADWEEIPTDLIAWGAPVVTNIDGLTKQLDDLWAGG